jgi:hypothetical protein
MIIAQGKRSAALGKEPKTNPSLFPSLVFPRPKAWEKPNSGKGRPGAAWPPPRAAARLRYAPAGLALGYYLAAPSGRRSSAEFSWLAPDPELPEEPTIHAPRGSPRNYLDNSLPGYREAEQSRNMRLRSLPRAVTPPAGPFGAQRPRHELRERAQAQLLKPHVPYDKTPLRFRLAIRAAASQRVWVVTV